MGSDAASVAQQALELRCEPALEWQLLQCMRASFAAAAVATVRTHMQLYQLAHATLKLIWSALQPASCAGSVLL